MKRYRSGKNYSAPNLIVIWTLSQLRSSSFMLLENEPGPSINCVTATLAFVKATEKSRENPRQYIVSRFAMVINFAVT